MCQWIKELRMSDGYSSNLARCVNVDKGNMHGMKSHDCHVSMECLLPIAFSSLSPHVLNPLIEISHFFKDLCSTTLMEDDQSRWNKIFHSFYQVGENIPPPPLVFSIQWNICLFIWNMKLDLVDLSNIDECIHLKGNKIIILFYLKFICLMLINHDLVMQICRFMGDSKRAMKNKARVEGSICVPY